MRKVMIALLILTAFTSASACDICGAGASSYNPFLNPHLLRHYLSVTYVHRHYQTLSDESIAGKEYYNSMIIGGQFTVAGRLQMMAAAPWQWNVLSNQYGEKKISGLGDISLLLNYKVFDKSTDRQRHTILLGAGIKLATAEYNPALKESGENFQLGTGSTDYLLNGMYRFGAGEWIFNAVGTYKYNTENASGYRYGDVLTGAVTIARRIAINQVALAPYLQTSMEAHMKDADKHILQQHSGGHVCYAGGGLDLSTKKMTFGISSQFSPSQHLAGGMITVKPSFSTHISFTL